MALTKLTNVIIIQELSAFTAQGKVFHFEFGTYSFAHSITRN